MYRSCFATRLSLGLFLTTFAACDPEPVQPMGEQALRAFASCNDLVDYTSDVAVESLIQSLYGYGFWMADDTTAEGESSGPSDYTTTNVQEQGVDELDIVKTDGQFIYVAQNDELLIVDSWPAEEANLVARVPLDGWTHGLFLDGDRVVVLHQRYYDTSIRENRWWSGTQATFVDVSDRSNPRVTRTTEFEGYLADARLIDGEVTGVLNSYIPLPEEVWNLAWGGELELPDMDWEAPEAEQERIREQARDILRPRVRRILQRTPVDDLLPLTRDSEGGRTAGQPTLLHECEDLHRPAEISHGAVLSVVQFPIDASHDEVSATGIISDGWTVYASQQNLYVAQSSWWSWWGFGDLELETHIHKFSLEDDGPRYAATGTVDGWLWNQFAMSEFDGTFRVATTTFDWWWGTGTGDQQSGSNLFVLADNDQGQLEPLGSVQGLAPGEQIQSVRMMGEKAYIVTFEQVDPLFTIDLSNPSNPRQVGELKLPGFSSYMHPLGQDHLLAVGMAGDWDGNIDGLAVTVFDVSDFANPRVAHQLELGQDGWAWSEALWDHHAFTYHRGMLSIPATTWREGSDGSWESFSGLYVLSVDADHIEIAGTIDHADLVSQSNCYYDWEGACEDYWYANLRRSIYIEDNLFSLSNYGMKVNDLYEPDLEHTRVLFDARN